MGFHRQIQPTPPPICIAIDDAVEAHIATLIAAHVPPAEPFGIAGVCPVSPTGTHQVIFDCGDVVCPHCATVLP